MKLTFLTLIALVALHSASLLAAPPKSYRDIAMEAIMQGDYEKAMVWYEKWTQADPGDAISLYNLACCHGKLEKPDQAISALARAVDAGWSDSLHTAEDPDLESLHGRAEFISLLAQAAHNARTRDGGRVVHTILQERTGEYVVVLPQEYDPSRPYPLVILLHGYGGSAPGFAQVTSLINSQDYIYAIPEGSYVAQDSQGKGFSFLRERSDFSEDPSSASAAADWIVRVADDMKKRYPVSGDKFWMVGFSQGAALAHLTAALHPERVAGYCAHGGYLIKNAPTPAQLEAAGKHAIPALITHAKADPAVKLEEGIYSFNLLTQAGYRAQIEQLDGTEHVFNAGVALRVAEWLRANSGQH